MISCKKVSRWFSNGATRVTALDALDLEIPTGEFTAITGPSGCGKSTLLHLLGGLDRASDGEVSVDGVDLARADEKTLTLYRREKLGIVFQFFNLLPGMSVWENVELPLLLQGWRPAAARERAHEVLSLVHLDNRATHFPHQLSGGQMQRAALARALVHRPALLLADEPTGNLDSANAHLVLDTMAEIAGQKLATMVVVTHSGEVAAAAARRIHLLDGKIITCPAVAKAL
jgi:ABC-type lipoprotein export system ATPase subunit